MKSFKSFYTERNSNDVGDDVVGNASLSEPEREGTSSLFKISRMAFDRYRNETLSFFRKLATKDEEISHLLDSVDDNLSNLSQAASKMSHAVDSKDKDEFIASPADGAGSPDDGDDI